MIVKLLFGNLKINNDSFVYIIYVLCIYFISFNCYKLCMLHISHMYLEIERIFIKYLIIY
jgi:hypothetical protein